jgi:phosphoribosylamine-glycine ligase
MPCAFITPITISIIPAITSQLTLGNLKEARSNAYAATQWVNFDNKYMRNDIGKAIDDAQV